MRPYETDESLYLRKYCPFSVRYFLHLGTTNSRNSTLQQRYSKLSVYDKKNIKNLALEWLGWRSRLNVNRGHDNAPVTEFEKVAFYKYYDMIVNLIEYGFIVE